MRPLLLAALLLAAPAWAAERRPVSHENVVRLINGSPIMVGSPECPARGFGAYVPSLQRARQIRDAVRLVMVSDIETGALTTTRTYAEWRVFTNLDWPTIFTERPTYGMWQVPPGYTPNCFNEQGEPRLCVCAAGIGTLPAVVDISDPARVEPLIAHETANGFLGFLQRGDLWDGAYVSSIVNRASALVGGWRTQE